MLGRWRGSSLNAHCVVMKAGPELRDGPPPAPFFRAHFGVKAGADRQECLQSRQ